MVVVLAVAGPEPKQEEPLQPEATRGQIVVRSTKRAAQVTNATLVLFAMPANSVRGPVSPVEAPTKPVVPVTPVETAAAALATLV